LNLETPALDMSKRPSASNNGPIQALQLSSWLGSVTFFLEFFWNFLGPREVGGTDDLNFEFGFTELETAGDVVGRDDLGVMQGSTPRANQTRQLR
jgi:hypothetical protein